MYSNSGVEFQHHLFRISREVEGHVVCGVTCTKTANHDVGDETSRNLTKDPVRH
jgi:hypothetical protein